MLLSIAVLEKTVIKKNVYHYTLAQNGYDNKTKPVVNEIILLIKACQKIVFI